MTNKKISATKTYENTGRSKDAISLNIVWADSGKRIKLSQSVLEHLDNPKKVSFAENNEKTGIYIQTSENGGFELGKAGTIYASSLIRNLISDFKLDFSECSSKTFHGEPGIDSDSEKPYVEIYFLENEMV